MKILALTAAGLLSAMALTPVQADAQPRHGWHGDRGWDRGRHNGWDRGRHRGWDRGRYYRGGYGGRYRPRSRVVPPPPWLLRPGPPLRAGLALIDCRAADPAAREPLALNGIVTVP